MGNNTKQPSTAGSAAQSTPVAKSLFELLEFSWGKDGTKYRFALDPEALPWDNEEFVEQILRLGGGTLVHRNQAWKSLPKDEPCSNNLFVELVLGANFQGADKLLEEDFLYADKVLKAIELGPEKGGYTAESAINHIKLLYGRTVSMTRKSLAKHNMKKRLAARPDETEEVVQLDSL